MPVPIIREGFVDALDLLIREWVRIGKDRRPTQRGQFFDVLPSTDAFERYENFGSIAPDAWRNFRKTGVASSVGFGRGFLTTFTHQTFEVELPVQAEFLEDNRYPEIMDASDQLGDSYTLLTEVDAASVFNNSTNALFPGGDAVALCSATHPQSPDNAAVQVNTGALALTKANLDTTIQAMQAFTDDVGNLVSVNPDTLIVPNALKNDARVLMESINDPSNATNAINTMYGQFKVAPWLYLTSTTRWFVVDSVLMKRALKWFDRVPFSVYPKVEDKTNWATWIARARYSYGWRDWRWIYGQGV